MSFGTSILEGFRKGFGRVLGGQNPRFSHFLNFFSIKIHVKLKLRTTSEKSKEPEARLSLPGSRPLKVRTLHGCVLATFY